MVEQPPAGRQQPCQQLRVQVDPLLADMLDHADARDRIERPVGHFAVVGQPDLNAIGQPRRGDPLSRERGLLLRQRDSDNAYSVARGSEWRSPRKRSSVAGALGGLTTPQARNSATPSRAC